MYNQKYYINRIQFSSNSEKQYWANELNDVVYTYFQSAIGSCHHSFFKGSCYWTNIFLDSYWCFRKCLICKYTRQKRVSNPCERRFCRIDHCYIPSGHIRFESAGSRSSTFSGVFQFFKFSQQFLQCYRTCWQFHDDRTTRVVCQLFSRYVFRVYSRS